MHTLRKDPAMARITDDNKRAAKTVIEESERIRLSERDSLLVLDLLENPPGPNAKLRRAIAAIPKPR